MTGPLVKLLFAIVGVSVALLGFNWTLEMVAPVNPGNPAFRIIATGGATPQVPSGDSLEAFRAAVEQGVQYAEANFVLTADGHLVTGHDDKLGGTCGTASERTLRELRTCRLPKDRTIATLPEFLAFGFEEVYIDLKTPGRAAAERAVAAIRTTGREDTAVLMVYDLSSGVAETIKGIRVGMKGYPETQAEVESLIDTAQEYGMELVCMEYRWLPVEVIAYAESRGVALVPWSEEPADDHMRELIVGGIAGIIVPDAESLEKQVRRS
jgi:glycerophosphoryl diester phosphodiesterase